MYSTILLCSSARFAPNSTDIWHLLQSVMRFWPE